MIRRSIAIAVVPVFAVAMAQAALLAGCGAGTAPTAVPVTPSPTVATATPPATPSAASERTYVSGTMACRIVGGEEREEKPGDYHAYQLDIDCSLSMSDPRVTGTAHYPLTATFITLDGLEGTSNFWAGTTTLETRNGGWKGPGYGSEFVSDQIDPMVLHTTGADVLAGEGANAGLTLRLFWARQWAMEAEAPTPYDVSGWIEPTS